MQRAAGLDRAAAADGRSNTQIAHDVGVHVDTVRTWRGRFAADGLKGPTERHRSGRPPVFAATVRAEVKALACSLPSFKPCAAATTTCPPVPGGPGGSSSSTPAAARWPTSPRSTSTAQP
jgi:hypothetical protein